MYIDNSVLLKQPPEAAFDVFLSTGQAINVFGQSLRETVADEFEAVMRLGYEDPQVCLELLERYRTIHPEVLDMKPIIGGVLLRKHMQPEVARAMETWWRHVLNYSRRDQLSFLAALKEAELVPTISDVNIRDNEYWTCRASTRRRT